MTDRNSTFTGPFVYRTIIRENGDLISDVSESGLISSQLDRYVSVSRMGNHKDPNPYYYEKLDRRYMKGTRLQVTRDGAWEYESSTTGFLGVPAMLPSLTSLSTDAAYNKALGKMVERLRGSLDLAVDIAQAGQTSSMVKDTLKLVNKVRRYPGRTLQDAYKAYKSPARATKDLSGKWLEYQYGWKPLAQSIYDTFDKLVNDAPRLTTVVVRASETEDTVTQSAFDLQPQLMSAKSCKKSTRALISLTLTDTESLAQSVSGYTSLNPASLAWESLPYSFVVDWVYDIGGYVRAMETHFLYRSRFVSGYKTLTKFISGQESVFDSKTVGNTTYSCYASASSREATVSRVLLDEFPMPNRPSFRADLGSGRILNAAALLSQVLLR